MNLDTILIFAFFWIVQFGFTLRVLSFLSVSILELPATRAIAMLIIGGPFFWLFILAGIAWEVLPMKTAQMLESYKKNDRE